MAIFGGRGHEPVPTDAIRKAASEANRLGQTIAEELETEARRALPGGLLLGLGASLGLVGTSALLVGAGLSVARRRPGLGVFALGAACAAVGVAGIFRGIQVLPKRPFASTREELREDLEGVAESLRH